MAGSTELRLSDLGRKLDDPGDAFMNCFYTLIDTVSIFALGLR